MASGSAHKAPSRSHVLVTPIWQQRPADVAVDLISITERTNANTPAFFVGPSDLDTGFYRERFPRWHYLAFDPSHFLSVETYSGWMTTPELYDCLREFEFMVMCQQDAVLTGSVSAVSLPEHDYLGAPWKPAVRILSMRSRISVCSDFGVREGPLLTRIFGRRVPVGNGGLSIRRIGAMRSVSRNLMKTYADRVRAGVLEDVYFCGLGPKAGLRVAPEDLAGTIFAESTAGTVSSPEAFVGFHGLAKWNPELLRSIRSDYGRSE